MSLLEQLREAGYKVALNSRGYLQLWSPKKRLPGAVHRQLVELARDNQDQIRVDLLEERNIAGWLTRSRK